jgi:predicted membrane protein
MMKVMLLLTDLFVWMIAYGAMLLGVSFLLSKIVPRMPNKASRFVVMFVLGMPYGMLYGYSKVWVHASSDMSWTEALILALPGALLGAILFTFWGPQSRNSKIQ